MSLYQETHLRSLRDPEGFWSEAARTLQWDRTWDRVLDDARKPFYRWFPGGLINTCHNALDRHVASGRADQPALIYDSPVTGTVRSYTFRELRDAASLFAGVLLDQGIRSGDRVILYLPMIPEAVIAMLGCARIGAVHSVVFGGFAAHELAKRIDDIINVAGHRLSTGAMEEVLAAHPDVAECAVIGVADEIKGELPVGLVVLKAGVTRAHDQITREIIAAVREKIGPVAAFKTAVVVTRLPKTRSGKILRSAMRKIAIGEPMQVPPTIDDPAILDEIAAAFTASGLLETHATPT